MTDQSGEQPMSSDVTSLGRSTKQRKLLLRTVRGLSEEQVRLRPTASALCLGGLLKHVTLAEQNWSRFITEGASAMRAVTMRAASPITPPPSR